MTFARVLTNELIQIAVGLIVALSSTSPVWEIQATFFVIQFLPQAKHNDLCLIEQQWHGVNDSELCLGSLWQGLIAFPHCKHTGPPSFSCRIRLLLIVSRKHNLRPTTHPNGLSDVLIAPGFKLHILWLSVLKTIPYGNICIMGLYAFENLLYECLRVSKRSFIRPPGKFDDTQGRPIKQQSRRQCDQSPLTVAHW